jgi:hypothetical protein
VLFKDFTACNSIMEIRRLRLEPKEMASGRSTAAEFKFVRTRLRSVSNVMVVSVSHGFCSSSYISHHSSFKVFKRPSLTAQPGSHTQKCRPTDFHLLIAKTVFLRQRVQALLVETLSTTCLPTVRISCLIILVPCDLVWLWSK